MANSSPAFYTSASLPGEKIRDKPFQMLIGVFFDNKIFTAFPAAAYPVIAGSGDGGEVSGINIAVFFKFAGENILPCDGRIDRLDVEFILLRLVNNKKFRRSGPVTDMIIFKNIFPFEVISKVFKSQKRYDL